METFAKQFEGAITRIEVNGGRAVRATEAHLEVRAALEVPQALRDFGVDTILIGSWARHTGIYPGKDVDVFTKLNTLDTTTSPTSVFELVLGQLIKFYRERAKAQNRSVKIEFPGDVSFSVDVVPAVRCGDHWAIPSRDQTLWEQQDSRWVITNPERLAALTTAANTQLTVSGRGAYVPLVKLLRQARQSHRRDGKPGGLYIEMATYDAFLNGTKGDTFAELFATTLQMVAERLRMAVSKPLVDPALGSPYTPNPEPNDVEATAEIFFELAALARQALNAPRCEAALLWRHILGTNERGVVFPLPPGCDETGKAMEPVSPNKGRGANEARAFG